MSSLLKSYVVEFGTDQDGPVTGNFLLIPAGAFYAGKKVVVDPYKPDREKDERRLVVVSKPFYMQETPVTQRQYQAVTGYNPSCVRKRHS